MQLGSCSTAAPTRRPLATPLHRCNRVTCITRRQCRARATQESETEPDWEAELKIFKQRTLKPSQLEVQRKLAVEQVEVGRVSDPGRTLWALLLSPTSASCPP